MLDAVKFVVINRNKDCCMIGKGSEARAVMKETNINAAIGTVNKDMLQFEGQDNFVINFFFVLFGVFAVLFMIALATAIRSRHKHRLTIWPRPIDNFDLDLENRNDACSIHHHAND